MAGKADFRGVLMALLVVAVLRGPALFAADAASLYKAKCALCHGADGKGDTPIGKKMGLRDFASPEVQKMSDTELITTVAKGKNKMPAYEQKLSNAEIKDLVAYIRRFAKAK
jgi:mono/diheme cytochrome c family protein